MGYLTDKKLNSIVDLPVTLPMTELQEGDWLVLATVRLTAPMRLTQKFLQVHISEATATVQNIISEHKKKDSLELVYIGVYKDYVGNDPTDLPTVDIVKVSDLGVTDRPTTPLIILQPGVYSWVLANNCKPYTPVSSSDPPTVITDPINFKVGVTGQIRIEMDKA
jgi:hypothetical protein